MGHRNVSEHRNREKEESLSPSAESAWNRIVTAQRDDSGGIRDAIMILIANMTALGHIVLANRWQVQNFMGIDCSSEKLCNRCV